MTAKREDANKRRIYRLTSVDESSRTLHAQVVGQLREAIVSGRIAPGTRLRTQDLADELGVSRIPVREAIGTLQAEGLVEFSPHRGATAASFSVDEIREVFLLRKQLEPVAARLAVERGPESLAQLLARLVAEMEGSEDDVSHWIDLDGAFHKTLYAASGYKRLCKLIDQLRTSIERYVRVYILAPQNIPSSRIRHREILEGCLKGDAMWTEQATREHLLEVERIFLDELEVGRTPRHGLIGLSTRVGLGSGHGSQQP